MSIHTRKIQSGFLLMILALMSFVNNSAARGPRPMQAGAERNNTDDRTIAEVVMSSEEDKFTQTEAHLLLKPVRDLIAKNYSSSVAPNLDIVSSIIANEGEYKDTHYAFYNTTSNSWRLAQDVYTRIYARLNPGAQVPKDFKFLRFNDESVETTDSTVHDFLVNELKAKGLVDDNTATALIMVSVNLSLFGNVGFPGECSWEYFVKPQGHAEPIRAIYENMMKKFGLSDKYIDELMALAKIYDTPEDTIIQILVPKDKIDEIGYLAWVKGIPAHKDTIQWILQHAKSKRYQHVKPTMEKLTEKFAKNQNNPLFKDMLAHVEAGDYSLDSFLKIYRNKPWDIKDINYLTARLLFTPDVLLNPLSGVKFFRFSRVTHEKLREYNNKLNGIIGRMIADRAPVKNNVRKNRNNKALAR